MSYDLTPDGLANAKSEMRHELMRQRASVAASADHVRMTELADERLTAVIAQERQEDLTRVVLAGYMAMRGELDPRLAMMAHPGPVCVPVIIGKAQPLEFHRWTADGQMVEGAFKALIPARADPLVPQILVVPLLAFDHRGYRLGYGGGFYDRTLEKLRAAGPVVAIGFAHDEQQVAQVPIDATDQRLDLIVTPERVIRPQ